MHLEICLQQCNMKVCHETKRNIWVCLYTQLRNTLDKANGEQKHAAKELQPPAQKQLKWV